MGTQPPSPRWAPAGLGGTGDSAATIPLWSLVCGTAGGTGSVLPLTLPERKPCACAAEAVMWYLAAPGPRPLVIAGLPLVMRRSRARPPGASSPSRRAPEPPGPRGWCRSARGRTPRRHSSSLTQRGSTHSPPLPGGQGAAGSDVHARPGLPAQAHRK